MGLRRRLAMKISRDKPFYYLTSVTKDRLPIFRTDELKMVLANAWNEARNSHRISIFAYVIMPDHVHLITDDAKPIADVLRLLNGISAKRLIDHLKQNGHEDSLIKLRGAEKERNHKHSVWQHHPNAFRITGEETLMQKVNYLHQNPVRAGHVGDALDYRFSSGGTGEGDLARMNRWRPIISSSNGGRRSRAIV